MTNNKNNSSPELNDPQGIDRSLLEYLKPKSEDRYSKLEAYCDLLTRATSGTYSTSVVVGNLKLLPGQFIATISELARKWQWQRATVRQFLTGLANLGHLTMEQFSKSYVFSVSQEQRFLSLLRHRLIYWTSTHFSLYGSLKDATLPVRWPNHIIVISTRLWNWR